MRHFLKKKLTFMLIPSSDGVARKFNLTQGTVFISAISLILVVTASVLLSSLFFSNQVDQSELEQLRAENKALNAKYEQLRWNLTEVENRYTELVEKEVKIRSLFELPNINTDERQLGIGGPTMINYDELTHTEQLAAKTEAEVDRLLRLSRFEIEKYNEVENSLTTIKSRLEHTPSIWPCKGWNSRGYGMKFDPFTGYKRMHRGIDIANNTGTPIIATADGKVEKVGTNSDMGKYIVIDHGYGFTTRYGHLSQIEVKRGQKVNRGDLIALMGSTGYSTGPHLHYEIIRNGKFLNPFNFIINEK